MYKSRQKNPLQQVQKEKFSFVKIQPVENLIYEMLAKVCLVLVLCFAASEATFTDACLDCICFVESNCNANIGCIMDAGSLSCGPFQIKEPYYIDCGSPGSDWQSCANNMLCAQNCVRAYMDRYGTYCTGDPTPVCEDYARIHNGGPAGCTCTCTDGYWDRVRSCCGSQTGCD